MLVVMLASFGLTESSSESCSEFKREKIEVEGLVVHEVDEVTDHSTGAKRAKAPRHVAGNSCGPGIIDLPVDYFSEHAFRNGIGRALTT